MTAFDNLSIAIGYTFDKTGRVKKINSTTLAYDAFDNMTAYGSDTYAYDSFGQRIRKTESSTTKYYVTSGPSPLAEYDGSANLQAEYIYGLRGNLSRNFGMVAQLDPSKGYLWLFTDHPDSLRSRDRLSAAPAMWTTRPCSATTRLMARIIRLQATTTCPTSSPREIRRSTATQ